MATHDPALSEDWPVEQLEGFCENIKGESNQQVCVTSVPRTKKQDDKGDGQRRKTLHKQVKAQVAASLQFAQIPIADASRSQEEQSRQEPQAQLDRNALDNRGVNNGDERKRHGQKIPDEARISRGEMIIRRAETGQRHAEEKHEIRNSFAAGVERSAIGIAHEESKAPDSNEDKRKIGKDVQTASDAENHAPIGKFMVAEP